MGVATCSCMLNIQSYLYLEHNHLENLGVTFTFP